MRNRVYIIGLAIVVLLSAAVMGALLMTPAVEDIEDDGEVVEAALEEPKKAAKPAKKQQRPAPAPPTTTEVATGNSLHGVITSTTGQPIAAEVIVAGSNTGQHHRARCSSDGRYKVVGLQPGQVTVVVRARGFRPTRENGVRVQGPTEKSFVLEPISGVIGKVLAPDGRPARGAWVQIAHSGGNRTVRTDGDGRFVWDRPGVDLASITAIAYTPWHGASGRGVPKLNEELVLQLTEGATIAGTVVDTRGQPVAAAAVAIQRCKGEPDHDFGKRFWRPVRTDERGKFRLERARPGSCDLTADSPKHAMAHADGVWTSSGSVSDNVTITLGEGGAVRGRVTTQGSGEPVMGARVLLFEPGSNLPPSVATTDREGNYELTGVAPGRHSVRAQHKEFLTELRGGVDVPDGGEVRRDFSLRKRKPGEKFAFQGIGATLGQTPEGVIIRNTMAGSPAAKFGLKNGDVIVSVDHEPMAGKGISTVVEKIRGEAGTPVMIEVQRPGQGRLTVSVERSDVVVK